MSLAEYLSQSYHLFSLQLSWNHIKGAGALALADALKDNQRLVFFDGSFNQFGSLHNGLFGRKMAEAVNKGVL